MTPVHGPERVSVLYVCGEGLATFQQLYCRRGIAPKMLCFIQCWGFAGNWTDFSDCGSPFHRTLRKYPECTPEWLCFGDCCGIHGAIRLRGLDYARVRCLGYRTREDVERIAGDSLVVMRDELDRKVLLYTKAGRRFLAVSVSHHMEFAVFDITDARLLPDQLLDYLILEEPAIKNHERYLIEWTGIRGLDDKGVPKLDEKLEWRFQDRFPDIARAIAVARSLQEIYGQNALRTCPQLLTGALEWAYNLLETTSAIRQENGLASLQRTLAKFGVRQLRDDLSSLPTEVHANIGFGRS